MSESRPPEVSHSAGALWRRMLVASTVTGLGAGILWWLLAPGGAFYGDGKNSEIWFLRDATLGILLMFAGLLSAVMVLRTRGTSGRRAERTAGRRAETKKSLGPATGSTRIAVPSTAALFALVVTGFVGSVIAWRMGVFAGDLFRTPPTNMANPSIVFSLRSASVLLLWPLISVVVVFFTTLVTYSLFPAAAATVPVSDEKTVSDQKTDSD